MMDPSLRSNSNIAATEATSALCLRTSANSKASLASRTTVVSFWRWPRTQDVFAEAAQLIDQAHDTHLLRSTRRHRPLVRGVRSGTDKDVGVRVATGSDSSDANPKHCPRITPETLAKARVIPRFWTANTDPPVSPADLAAFRRRLLC